MPSVRRPPERWSSVATCFARSMGSCWAISVMPVPRASRSVTAAACPRATKGSRVRPYSSGSSPPAGYGVSRLTGMWVCSGRYSPANPRCSSSRATRTGVIVRSVRKIVVAIRMGGSSVVVRDRPRYAVRRAAGAVARSTTHCFRPQLPFPADREGEGPGERAGHRPAARLLAVQLLDLRVEVPGDRVPFQLQGRGEVSALLGEVLRQDRELADGLRARDQPVGLVDRALQRAAQLLVVDEFTHGDVLLLPHPAPVGEAVRLQGDQGPDERPVVADHHALADQRVGPQPVLQRRGGDVLAARRDDDVLLAAG